MKKTVLVRRSKTFTAMALAAALCASLSACGSSSSTTSTTSEETQSDAEDTQSEDTESTSTGSGGSLRIAWWGSQDRHNSTIEALDLYTEETGIELTYEYSSWTSYFETLAAQAVGGNLPDVIQMSTSDIVNYSQNGQIIDLQSYVDDGTIDTSNMEENSLSGGEVDGQLAGITTGHNTFVVVYNTDIFDQAGVDYPSDDWTWSDFFATAEAIYDATGIQTEIPFLSEARWIIQSMVQSMGYDFFSEDGGALPWAEDDAVVSALTDTIQRIYDAVQDGYLVDPEVQSAWSTTEDYYISQGNSAMSMVLSNQYTTYSSALGEVLGQAMLPQMDEGTQSGMTLNPNMYWSISANCTDPQAAAELINYLINDEEAARLIGTDRGVSLSSAIREMLEEEAEDDVYTKSTLEYMDRVSSQVSAIGSPDPLNSSELMNVMKNDYVAVMYGEMTAEECVADIIAQAASIL